MSEPATSEPAQYAPTAVVTGASSGIGREIAIQLADFGWNVVAIARRAEILDELVSTRPQITPLAADITEYGYFDSLPSRIDAVVHAAGTLSQESIEDASPRVWAEIFELNVTAGAELVRQSLGRLRESQGTIVFINSGAGIFDAPKNAIYGASKHALRVYANSLRAQESAHGVRVTTVFPGPTDTPLFTGDVDREKLIQPSTVAAAVVGAITAPADAQLTEIQVRPRAELTW